MLEPVVEDLYVEETSSHPDLYKRCKRQNSVVEKVTPNHVMITVHVLFICKL